MLHGVAPTEREHTVNPTRLQKAGDQCSGAGVGHDGGHLWLLQRFITHYCILNSEYNKLVQIPSMFLTQSTSQPVMSHLLT
jgi:hypothetical protein